MKPGLPQGMRDFTADVVRRRRYILDTVRGILEGNGFEPLETPAMENLETLMGKYGEEGDRLIFKVLNNGLDNPDKHGRAQDAFQQVLAGRSSRDLTERALRYDLTIPFARFVAMNHARLTLPFKRYQMQPVWRADRPQKGRYREFWQCDADIVGSASLVNEAGLVRIYRDAFRALGVPAEIRINNRKVLAALAEVCGGSERLADITVAIDKLDKIGMEKVREELGRRGLTETQISFIDRFLSISGDNGTKMAAAEELLGGSEQGRIGLSELRWLADFTLHEEGGHPFTIDFTLARGLDYYTGTILEVKALGVGIGSIGGGGRYDDLTGLFGVPGVPGVGISFGVDRIYDVMEELKLFPESLSEGTRVLFFHLGEAECRYAWKAMEALQAAGIACETYPDPARIDRQFKYADKKRIPMVVICGTEEMAKGLYRLKELESGIQQDLTIEGLLERLKA